MNRAKRRLDPLVGIHLIKPTYCGSSLQEADSATVQKNIFPLHFAAHE
jgi:hypothetical protein